MLDKYEAQNAGPSSRCASFLSETIDVVRTITSLNYQSAAMANFEKKNSTTKRSALYLNFGAIGFAFSQGAMDWLQALLFFWGGKLVAREGMTTKQLFACYEAIVIAVSCNRVGHRCSNAKLWGETVFCRQSNVDVCW